MCMSVRITLTPPYLHANFDRISVQYFFALKPLKTVYYRMQRQQKSLC